jgi:hypothetical protein
MVKVIGMKKKLPPRPIKSPQITCSCQMVLILDIKKKPVATRIPLAVTRILGPYLSDALTATMAKEPEVNMQMA